MEQNQGTWNFRPRERKFPGTKVPDTVTSGMLWDRPIVPTLFMSHSL